MPPAFLAAVGPNPFNQEPGYRRFDPVAAAQHDLRLLDFQLQALRGIQADISQSAAFPAAPVSLSDEQLRIAERIDGHAQAVASEADGTIAFMIAMSDYMDDFQRLMDISSDTELAELCEDYDGLDRFAKCLEEIARGIADGDISPES